MSDLDELVRATTRIVSPAATGTGFFIAPGLIATCAHVAGANGDAVDVFCKDGRSLRGTVLDRDDVADVALIRTDAGTGPNLPLEDATETYRRNDWIAYGFPRIAKSGPVLIE